MKTKIFWNDDEKQLLIKRVTEIKIRNTAISLLQALSQAQGVLSEHRRRHINTESVVPWLRPGVEDRLRHAKEMEEVRQRADSPVIDVKKVLEKATPAELLESLVTKLGLKDYAVSILSDLITRAEVAQLISNQVQRFIEPTKDVKISTGKFHEREIPRVMILGLKNVQQREIEEEYAAAFSLKFMNGTEYSHAKVVTADYVLGMVDFLSHPTDAAAKKHFKDHYIRVTGTMSSLKTKLNEILHKE